MKLSLASPSAKLAAVSAAILWALGSIMTKHLLSQFGPIDLLAIELAASTLSLWAMLAFVPWQAPSLTACLRLASPGFLQPGLAYLLSFFGLQWTSASLETLVWSSESVIMLLFASIFLGESVSRFTMTLSAVALAGVIIASLSPALGTQSNPSALLGNALILAAVLAACAYTVFAQRDLSQHEPLPLTALHQLASLVFVLLARALWPVPAAPTTLPLQSAPYLEAALAGICLFSAPFWLYLRSIQVLGSAKAAQFLLLVPVFTLLLAIPLLKETISAPQIIGSLITLAAISALSFQQNKTEVEPF